LRLIGVWRKLADMRNGLSIRDFVAGTVFGLVLGSAGLSTAALGYSAWEKLSDDFKVGYVTGFLSLANLTRNFDPGGWLDTKYPAVPNATPVQWAAEVDKLYKDPKMHRYSIHSVLQTAATELQKIHGKPVDPYTRVQQRAQTQLQALQRRQEAQAKKLGKPAPAVKNVQAPEKKVAVPATKPARKWCRCDGKDPKAERARRRAEAAKKAEAAKQGEAGNGEKGDAQNKDEAARPAAPAVK
jgi:hypothetical protein